MNFLTWGRNPWGQQILTHVSWDLLWASLFAGLMFLVAHGSYMILSYRRRSASETDVLEAANKDLPPLIPRHSFMARLFHWVQAAAMFTLLFTAFLPIVGVRFAWVQYHWIAGLVLTGSIIYHIIHASFFLDFWSIWVGPKDIPELRAELLRELGHEVPGPKPGKYPLAHRLYHVAIVVVGLASVITGILMMSRIRTPLFTRNPYLFSDFTWGFTYVLHGFAGVALIGLVIAHIYFAVRPEKWWITKSMIVGWVTRRSYLEHHDPARWNVRKGEGSGGRTDVSASLEEARTELSNRCDAIEECYEFMLAYAGQGLDSDAGSSTGSQVREFLRKCDAALASLAEFIGRFVKQDSAESMAPYTAFLTVIDRDARDARAAVSLVLAQPSISSQLVDNLNASIHLRALLTDLFLIDEVLKTHRGQG